jgi:transposase
MGQDRATPSAAAQVAQGRADAQAQPRLLRRPAVDPTHRRAVEGHARLFPLALDVLASPGVVGSDRRLGGRVAGVHRRTGRRRPRHVGSGLRRRDVRAGEKGGDCVGKTKRGKGTKLVVVGSGASVPLACTVASASPSATRLIEPTLDKLTGRPARIVMDKEFDSDKFRDRIAARGIDPIIPYRYWATERRYDDRRKLRRYKKRWVIERLFAWLGNFRRLVVRYERKSRMFQAFVHVAFMLIALRQL